MPRGAKSRVVFGLGSCMSSEGPTWTHQIRKDGEFVRKGSVFRNAISSAPGAPFAPESGRYHLYVSLACPWAHRTLILRRLKGLEAHVSYDVVDWFLPHSGWTLLAKTEGATRDSVNQVEQLRELYLRSDPDYRGSFTVPVLFDKKRRVIVNNESEDIVRFFNSEFNEWSNRKDWDFFPVRLRPQIVAINEWVYEFINNGVYRCGFARSQAAYDRAVTGLFEHLDRAEALLSRQRYLLGDRLTEADVRLFTTLIRFDAVYATHFKCNVRRLVDYPNLWGFTRELYAHPAFRETTDFAHIKNHYFQSHESINPHRIVAAGYQVDYEAPHDRNRFPAAWFPES